MVDEMENMEDSGEESFAELFEKSFVAGSKLEPGQRVDAKVIKITKNWVFLEVGQKGEGVVDKKELTDADGHVNIVEGRITSYNVCYTKLLRTDVLSGSAMRRGLV